MVANIDSECLMYATLTSGKPLRLEIGLAKKVSLKRVL